ncbi:MAG TPA: DUF3592 domain-containing protein [Fontimonas sp.]
MRLELCDRLFCETTSAQDIAAALAQGPRDAHWSLLLEAGNDFLLAEAGESAGRFELQYNRGDERLSARATLDDAQLQALFVSVLDRDDRWRGLCKWRTPDAEAPEDEAQYSASTNRAAGIYGTAFAALFFLVAIFPDRWLPGWLPPSLQSSGGWLVLLMVLGIPGIVVAAAIVKLREVRRASAWPQTIGRIVSSERIVARRKRSGEAQRTAHRPALRYEYQAGGRRYTGSRISIGEIADNDPRLDEILTRYAVGNRVTVYYQPDRPANSVLERDPPVALPVLWGVVGAIFAGLVGLAGLFLFAEPIADALQAHLPPVRHPYLLVLFSVLTGLALLRTIRLLLRPQGVADRGVAAGRIEVSAVDSRSEGLRKRNYVQLEYSYSVDGKDYRGSQIRPGVQVSGTAWIVRRQIERYPVGSVVDVHYDKRNPADAALQPPATGTRGGALTALLVCGFIAWYFATH